MRGATLLVLTALAACVGDEARLTPESVTCPPGQTNCGGACVDIGFHPQHCGACHNACAAGELCSLAQCGNECLGGTSQCGSLCVDLSNDNANCGACEVPCPSDQICSGGMCGLDCVGGTVLCSGQCVDTDVDPGNCGDCGKACSPGAQCCGGSCIDTTTDPLHCGSCEVACTASQLCVTNDCIEAVSCLAIKTLDPTAADGVFSIDPDGSAALPPVSTYCDMTTEGGGWTLLAKTVLAGLTAAEAMTLHESFWADYTDTGYGDPALASRLFWMPLAHWHALTAAHPTNAFWQKSNAASQVRVNDFAISDAAGDYAWSWGGTASGFLGIYAVLEGRKFTARDMDNDIWGPGNCSSDNIGLNGGFWYESCAQLSMLHVNGSVYRLNNNVQTPLQFSELYLR